MLFRTLAAEAAPIAKNVSYSPAPGVNITAKANYTYEDVNNDPEGASSYQWYTATNASGAGQTAISGATSNEFYITSEYGEKHIGLGITPKALTGNLTGTEVVYYAPTASIPAADFTIVSATQNTNNFYINRVMSASDYITVGINVTTAGSIKFTTNTANGYSFSAEGTYNLGLQDVTLVANGKQLNYNVTGDNFTITADGFVTKTTSTTITNTKLGNQFTEHFNGIENNAHNITTTTDPTYYLKTSYTTGERFSNQSICSSKPISTSACLGTTITVGSNTYSITNINGQCWMQQNLKELPNGGPISTIPLGTVTKTDIGSFGFFNKISGANTWAQVEPAPGEGILYQWSAAMLGATNERAKGVCPSGWHIPSDCEFLYLEHGLGLSLNTQQGGRGITAADGYIASKLSFVTPPLGNNSSGFTGLLAGRMFDGSFTVRGAVTNFWTSTSINNDTAISAITLENSKTNTDRSLGGVKRVGFSVRCLKD
jgi:uncharacterized protein (TIGR02145 family)